MNKRRPFQVGDRVRIKEPIFVQRVGYPLGIEDGIKYIQSTMHDKISELLGVPIGYEKYSLGIVVPMAGEEDYDRRQIERALAYRWLKQQGFGGARRTLHTKTIEEDRGREATIDELITRKTGRRREGILTESHFDGPEWEPPYLDEVQTHRIARLSVFSNSIHEEGQFLQIETKHLEWMPTVADLIRQANRIGKSETTMDLM